MKVVLTTLNAKYIHTNLALRWLYVARDKSFDVEIKEYTIKDDLIHVAGEIEKANPDIVGISVYIWNCEETKVLIQHLHEKMPKLKIILGGPEVSFDVEEWLEYPIEAILRGEGEKVFWQACRGESNIDGYVSKKEVSATHYAKVDVAWLEQLESPYYLSIDDYHRQHRYLYFETSRGCPYQCSYCLSSMDNQVRLFSEKYIRKQLQQLTPGFCKQVKFLDRTFNVDSERALNIAKLIEELKVDFSFQFEIVIDSLSENLLSFFAQSSKERFRFEVGVQTFNKDSLKNVRRIQSKEKLKTNIQRLVEVGCLLHVDLIGGLPYEDLKSFKASFTELFSLKAEEIQVGLLKLLKGTPLREQAETLGLVYNYKAPYTIEKTPWMTTEDVGKIEKIYQGVEKLYNSQRARETLLFCFQQGISIVDVFEDVGSAILNFKGQVQVKDMFLMLYQSLRKHSNMNEKELQALLNNDYYMGFKQAPPSLFNEDLSKMEIKRYKKEWVKLGIFDEQELYKYGKIKLGYNQNKIQWQVLIYNAQQQLPKRVWITQEEK
ncbi:MAG: DUF4080 domain-containing protein [Anaerorhabdus sp.]